MILSAYYKIISSRSSLKVSVTVRARVTVSIIGFGFRDKDCSLYKIIRQIFYLGTCCTGNENKDRDDRTRLVLHDRAYHYMTF